MPKYRFPFIEQIKQYVRFLVLLFVNIIFTILLLSFDFTHFDTYFPSIHPMMVIVGGAVLGISILSNDRFNRQFFSRTAERSEYNYYTWFLVMILACIAITVDVLTVFPEDMNVLFPTSLMFYPVMGFIVEIFLHLIPLFLVLKILPVLLRFKNQAYLINISILIVALIEPLYQVVNMELMPTWAIIITGMNIYIFNLIQL